MQFQDVWLLLAFFVLVLAPAPFLGRYLYRVMEGQKTLLTPLPGLGAPAYPGSTQTS